VGRLLAFIELACALLCPGRDIAPEHSRYQFRMSTYSEIEGLFTVLICIPCLEIRLAQPDTLPGLHDPGQPWNKWGCPIDGCGR
jgi:hypothetical protein